MTPQKKRAPRVFDLDDPRVVRDTLSDETDADGASEADQTATEAPAGGAIPYRGLRWGGLLLGALGGVTALAASISFARFVSVAFERDDWVGQVASVLLAVAAFAAVVIVVRELVGLLRLARVTRVRKDAAKALLTRDRALERSAVQHLRRLYAGRPDLKWALARLRDHEGDVRDAGELLMLADRELMAPIDAMAKRTVVRSAKRVSVVTAMSPMAWIAMLYVVAENLRMLKTLAGHYGGRPGGLGALKLGRMVMVHILATGGLAMTDDLLGQFLGQDLLRRLSRRLGEGAFNGALTARIGTAAIEVTRPLPFIAASPVRLRDLIGDVFRRSGSGRI